MKRTYLVIISLIGISLFAVGCAMPMRLRYQFDPPLGGEVLYSEDFSDTSSWDIWSDELSIVDYNSGGLRFFVNQPNFTYWSRPQKFDFKDVQIEVKAIKVSGPDDNNLGLICRYVNRDNFYYFIISSDGYYGIMKVLNGVHTLISNDQLQFSEVVRQGDRRENWIQVECNGPNLVLTVNDVRLAVAYDADFEWGGVGLLVGTYDQVGVDILFDDFKVVHP